ncbi:hypothetical protein N7510_009270 [Penicillium lagena]|uniref:uncharacterized protein n=1 Tax=Penicillium lagena TaxID=94218 RepID=UPI0025408288|nr:uncharacterized protein N7510_009270 [Penicillium lagena]KAJ5606489.1 hypothetical protein N7510_009270 [Penicillium lagena]
MSSDSDLDRDSLPIPSSHLTWPARLSYLASTLTHFPEDSASAQTIHRCLDTISSVLQHDTRPGFGQEIAKYRPPHRHSLSLTSGVTAVEPESESESPLLHVRNDDEPRAGREMQSQLMALLREVTALNGELDSRRREAGEIYELLEGRCRELTRTIAELEGEVVELQADLVEDAVELEGIQGTVHGLQGYIDALREEQRVTRVQRLDHRARQKETRRNGSRKEEELGHADGEMVLEGIAAWMRGWRDVEEGFQVRARARQLNRERRQERWRGGEKISYKKSNVVEL